jgi:hypothetical protein
VRVRVIGRRLDITCGSFRAAAFLPPPPPISSSPQNSLQLHLYLPLDVRPQPVRTSLPLSHLFSATHNVGGSFTTSPVRQPARLRVPVPAAGDPPRCPPYAARAGRMWILQPRHLPPPADVRDGRRLCPAKHRVRGRRRVPLARVGQVPQAGPAVRRAQVCTVPVSLPA